MKHRIAARVLLKENNKILFIRYEMKQTVFYALPGGAHEVGESLANCAQREIKEETAIDVDIKHCLLVNEFTSQPFNLHQVEIIFLAQRSTSQIVDAATFQDPGMTGFHWLSKVEMEQVQFYPEKPIDWFFKDYAVSNDIYFHQKR